MDLELNHSIPDRNVDLETKLLNRYYNDFINYYISKIEQLNCRNDFIRDDSFNGIKSPEHIIYKLRTNENGDTCLSSKDGNRAYEFVIEFDKKDSAYGIYYGCKGLILGGNQEKEINVFVKEWDSIKKEVSYILNNTFPDKNFFKRYKMTNNANNKTFWPFWIPLYEEEDVIEIAARAVRIICNIYKLRIIDGIECKDKINTDKLESNIYTLTAYTDERYEIILNKLNPEDRELYTTFLTNATEFGFFEKDPRYEKCWRVKDLKNIEVHYLLKVFFQLLSTKESPRNNKWDLFQPILLSNQGNPIDFKRANSTTSEYSKNLTKRDLEAQKRMNMILYIDKKK